MAFYYTDFQNFSYSSNLLYKDDEFWIMNRGISSIYPCCLLTPMITAAAKTATIARRVKMANSGRNAAHEFICMVKGQSAPNIGWSFYAQQYPFTEVRLQRFLACNIPSVLWYKLRPYFLDIYPQSPYYFIQFMELFIRQTVINSVPPSLKMDKINQKYSPQKIWPSGWHSTPLEN